MRLLVDAEVRRRASAPWTDRRRSSLKSGKRRDDGGAYWVMGRWVGGGDMYARLGC